MNYSEMTEAIQSAEATLRAGDMVADRIARLLPTRLRCVNGVTLAKLKTELRKFNIHTQNWKE